MEKETLENKTIIRAEFGEITEICPPEDIQIDLTGKLYKDFQSDVNGLPEHYIAVAVNYTDEDSLQMAIDYFLQ